MAITINLRVINGTDGAINPMRHVIQDSNVSLLARSSLNFDSPLVATDDSGNNQSDITLDESLINHSNITGLGNDDHIQYLNESRHDSLPSDNPHSVTLTQSVTADVATDVTGAELETLTDGSNADSLHSHSGGVTDHGALTGLADDDHTQYLNETRHDALAADNPHSVTVTQAITSDVGTDVTVTELETLTDGSNADALHVHAGGVTDHGALTGLTDDDHTQYHLTDGTRAMTGRHTINDSASTPPLNITERSTEPTTPSANDLYLDDGTNTASGNPGWRRYTGVVWEDVSAGGGGGGVTGSGVDNQVALWNGASAIDGDADLTYDGTTLSLTGSNTALSMSGHTTLTDTVTLNTDLSTNFGGNDMINIDYVSGRFDVEQSAVDIRMDGSNTISGGQALRIECVTGGSTTTDGMLITGAVADGITVEGITQTGAGFPAAFRGSATIPNAQVIKGVMSSATYRRSMIEMQMTGATPSGNYLQFINDNLGLMAFLDFAGNFYTAGAYINPRGTIGKGENLIRFSETLTDPVWDIIGGTTVVANVNTAPDGKLLSADRVTMTNGDFLRQDTGISVLANRTFTALVWVKNEIGTANFRIRLRTSAGTEIAAILRTDVVESSFPNDQYLPLRITGTVAGGTPSGETLQFELEGFVNTSYAVWGASVVENDTPLGYIPTQSIAVPTPFFGSVTNGTLFHTSADEPIQYIQQSGVSQASVNLQEVRNSIDVTQRAVTSAFHGTRLDNVEERFGTADDAAIYYDGVDLVIDPDVVGVGVVNFAQAPDANDVTVATLGNTPTGVAAASSEWLQIKVNGNVRYVPLWT